MSMSQDTQVYNAIAKRILQDTGKNSSNKAAEMLSEIMEEEGHKYARKARHYAEHAGRKTIKPEDLEAAIKDLNE